MMLKSEELINKVKSYNKFLNPDTLNKSDAAKIFFLLRKGSLNMIDLRVRYKGDFVIKPQFQGYMTPEFKAEIAKECAGT